MKNNLFAYRNANNFTITGILYSSVNKNLNLSVFTMPINCLCLFLSDASPLYCVQGYVHGIILLLSPASRSSFNVFGKKTK
jgi:hypothetical protein